MALVGGLLVALGILCIWIKPKWLPRFVRQALPHVGIIVLAGTAVADNVAIGHLEGQIAVAPDSSLRTIAPALLKVPPRTMASALPPVFVGTSSTLSFGLQAAAMLAAFATIIAFTRPEWLRPVYRTVQSVAYALVILFAAWMTGFQSRALDPVRAKLQVDANAPLRSIGGFSTTIAEEYRSSVGVMLVIVSTGLYVWGLRFLHQRLSRRGNAA